MNHILIIARDAVSALLRQRLLPALMLVCLAMTVFFSFTMSRVREGFTEQFGDAQTNSPVFQKMSEDDRKKMTATMEQGASAVQGFFYAATSFGGSLVALLIFSTAVASEIRKGSIRLILSKPVTRLEYLLGKFLGGVVVMAGYAIVSSAAVLIFSQTADVTLSPVLAYAPWLMFCRQLMLGAAAMLFSLFVHPAIGAVVAFFAGNGLCAPPNPLYFLLPSYAPFNLFTDILQGSIVKKTDVMLLTLYALDFVAIMLLLANWRFKNKEVT